MKLFLSFASFVFWLLMGCQQTEEQPTLAELPLKAVEGYGPFEPSFGILKGEGLERTQQIINGIPHNWTNVQPYRVELNYNQLIYQNYFLGKITKEWYEGFKKHTNWVPDETKFTKKPIKCYVHTLKGYDTKLGKWLVMIDTNNNLNFSDETPFEPEIINGQDPFSYKIFHLIRYEVYQKGITKTAHIPMVIKRYGDDFFYNFPQYYKATLKKGFEEYNLVVSSSDFVRPDFSGLTVSETPKWPWQRKVARNQLIELGQNILIGGTKYKNKGVDFYNNVLQLDPVSAKAKEYLLQAGYPFRPFKAQEFTTKQSIALADYQGKYVYIDFWWTGCKGCLEDLPALKKMYQELDKTRFEFIGISPDSPQRLSEFIKRRGIIWPQIISDSTNKFVESYGVTGYPTSVLLDQQGIVIAKDLRGEQLAAKLNELGN